MVKRLAETEPERLLHRGYIATCDNCGLRVVHARTTNEPFAMHARSFLCAKTGASRRGLTSFTFHGRTYAVTAKTLADFETPEAVAELVGKTPVSFAERMKTFLQRAAAEMRANLGRPLTPSQLESFKGRKLTAEERAACEAKNLAYQSIKTEGVEVKVEVQVPCLP